MWIFIYEHALLTGPSLAIWESPSNSARRGGNEKGAAPAKAPVRESSVTSPTDRMQRPWKGKKRREHSQEDGRTIQTAKGRTKKNVGRATGNRRLKTGGTLRPGRR
jgi:hypothetical protein